MKKVLSILIIAAVIITALCIWQRNNIEALFMFITKDKEEVSKIIEDNKQNLEAEIKKYAESMPRDFTEEEEAMIASGEMTVEEATELLLKETETEEIAKPDESVAENNTKEPDIKGNEVPEEKPSGNNVVSNESEKTEQSKGPVQSNKSKESAIIKSYTAKFYSMKAYYMGQLSQIEANARNEYSAMNKQEKKNLSKAAFVGKYVSYATALQSECDSKVNELLDNMKSELKAVNGDVSIISTIRQAYSNEKAARKAYYMNLVS